MAAKLTIEEQRNLRAAAEDLYCVIDSFGDGRDFTRRDARRCLALIAQFGYLEELSLETLNRP